MIQVKVFYTAKLRDNGHVFDSNIGKSAYKFRLGMKRQEPAPSCPIRKQNPKTKIRNFLYLNDEIKFRCVFFVQGMKQSLMDGILVLKVFALKTQKSLVPFLLLHLIYNI